LLVIDECIPKVDNLVGDIHEGRTRRRGEISDDNDHALFLDDEQPVCFPRRRGNTNGIGKRYARKSIGAGISNTRRVRRHLDGGIRNTLKRSGSLCRGQ